jgi:5'-3' exonuclease
MGNQWIKSFYIMIKSLARFNIKTVFIFDGNALPAKKIEHEKRKEQKNKLRNDILTLTKSLELYKKEGIVNDILLETQKKYQNKLSNLLSIREQKINIELIETVLEKKKCQDISITKHDIEQLKRLFEIYKIPYYVATNEAESMCSALCIKQKVDAVLSSDTDVLVYGTPTFIYNINFLNNTCDVIVMDDLLKKLDININQFRTFCIMCGTDYNKNINKIGPVNSFKLIKKYENIDELFNYLQNDKKKDISVLNYQKCMSIFTNENNKEDEIDINLNNIYKPDISQLEIFKFQHNLY